MSVEFENAILAGVTLIREAIQSQNYEAGSDGWQIAADGSAEFSDLTIRSSDGSGSTVMIANGEIRVLNGDGDTVVEIDSTGYRLYSDTGQIVAEIKLDGGGARGGFYTRNFAFPQNVYAFLSGGQLTSGPVDNTVADIHGFLQYVMTDTAVNPYAVQTLSSGALDLALDDEARIQLVSERGQRPVAWVDGGSSAIAANLRVTGTVIADELQLTDTTFAFHTPVIANAGTATFTSRTGWSYNFGDIRFFNASFTVGAAGSGATAITVTAPSSIYRDTEQTFSCHTTSTTVAGAVMNGNAVSLTGGAGNVIDRISVSNNGTTNRDNILTGALLLAGATVTIQGFYRES